MDKSFDDYFLILEVHMLASEPVIKAAYKKLCQIHHPDNGGDGAYLHKVQEAYEVLVDQSKRRAYLRVWKRHYMTQDISFEDQMNTSLYDIAFRPLKKVVIDYMDFIMNNDYEAAYAMLSDGNKKRIFKRNFILWQRLIGEVHQLLEFDCVVDTFNQQDYGAKLLSDDEKVVTFRVKITELNLLLNRVEEDFFQRDIVYENGEWRILLPDIDIKNIIKKYRKIIAISKKNKKEFYKQKGINKEIFLSKALTFTTFINNCEYEFLRYQRYERPHNILRISVESRQITDVDYAIIEKILEKNTRNLDSFCRYNESTYLVLLPETNGEQAKIVSKKLYKLMENADFGNESLKVDLKRFEINKSYQGTKELLKEIANLD